MPRYVVSIITIPLLDGVVGLRGVEKQNCVCLATHPGETATAILR